MDAPYQIPPNFLSHPSPTIHKQTIDFPNSNLPEYAGYHAYILDSVFTPSECTSLIHAVKAANNNNEDWEQATINSGFNGQEVDTESRLCGRTIWDNPDLASRIWNRCKDHLPEICEVEQAPHVTGDSLLMKGWRFGVVGLNERMRFLRYHDGDYFRPHFDGTYRTKEKTISFFTLHLYLNEADEDSVLEGGATTFHALDWSGRKLDVVPKVGRVLVFQQKGLLHSGADVKRGIKYTMRTDVMHQKIN
ncbi:MAG: hypothetical protein Q9169_006730 [Polycauliona sp. 2 TL-2023]